MSPAVAANPAAPSQVMASPGRGPKARLDSQAAAPATDTTMASARACAPIFCQASLRGGRGATASCSAPGRRRSRESAPVSVRIDQKLTSPMLQVLSLREIIPPRVARCAGNGFQ